MRGIAPAHQDVERDEPELHWDGHRGDDHQQQRAAAAEAQLGEGEAGQSGEQHHRDRHAAGDQHRVGQPAQEVREKGNWALIAAA